MRIQGLPWWRSGGASACSRGAARRRHRLASWEGGTAARSGVLAWRISRTEEPGGLRSMGAQSGTRLR